MIVLFIKSKLSLCSSFRVRVNAKFSINVQFCCVGILIYLKAHDFISSVDTDGFRIIHLAFQVTFLDLCWQTKVNFWMIQVLSNLVDNS